MDGINLPKCKPSPSENEVYLFCYRIVHSANSLSHVPSSCKAYSSGSSSPTTMTHAIFFITFISLFKTLLVTFAEFFLLLSLFPFPTNDGWVILFSSILLIVLFSQYVLHFSFFFICCTCSSSLLQPSSVSKFPRSARSSFFFFYLR